MSINIRIQKYIKKPIENFINFNEIYPRLLRIKEHLILNNLGDVFLTETDYGLELECETTLPIRKAFNLIQEFLKCLTENYKFKQIPNILVIIDIQQDTNNKEEFNRLCYNLNFTEQDFNNNREFRIDNRYLSFRVNEEEFMSKKIFL